MSGEHEYSYHLIEEREFRERFLPAVQGDEPIVRELLEAADASGPSWTALHKLFDETRPEWLRAAEQADGEAAQRTLFAAFARLVAHLRPTYCVKGFSLRSLETGEFSDLLSQVRSPGLLLREPSGGVALPGVSQALPGRVPAGCQDGRSGGGFIPAGEVRSFLEAFRRDLPRLVSSLGSGAEPGLTVLLSALVEAKLQGKALLEACDALVGDEHLPSDHRLSFTDPQGLPPAVVREIAKAYGKTPQPPPAPAEPPEPEPEPEVVDYRPQGTYQVGQRIRHKSFGEGTVTEIVDSRRFRAGFGGQEKVLVQGLKGELTPSSETLDPVGSSAPAADEHEDEDQD